VILARTLLLVGTAVQAQAYPTPPPPVEPDAIVETLFLIGDAGKPAKGGEPVLLALRRQLERSAGRSTVAFLGDNVYPHGLPGPGDPEFPEMARRIDDQVDAVKDTGARVIFIPGNHDWGGRDGWQSLLRQEKRVEERGGPRVSFLPHGGCPGPEIVDASERLRLVALDTQWWLDAHDRLAHPGSSCLTHSEDEIVTALRAALEGAGARDVVVLGHHPLQSSGPHGGRFGFVQHLFPLTELKENLYIPLPIVGSIYPVARGAGSSAQDIPSGEYRRMRAALAAASGHRPLAWVGGHEHVLQVIESPEWGRVLVSGAGIYGHLTYVKEVEGSLYRAARSGFMRIDFLRDGHRRLGVVEVEKDGRYREAFARILE